ncbi:MAG: biopolymer transporter ExbD [Gemmatimonadetes bacterium]|nr:biopolymer transporter ExbD [Gemmatimonadota bacterium]
MNHDRPLAEINVINLVDVMLVLLVLFIITAPLLRGGIDVELPRTRAARPLESAQGILVTVTEGGEILVDGEETAKDELVETIRARRGDLLSPVYLAGDSGADYGAVVSVLGLLTDAGVDGVGLVAEPARRRRK